MTYYQMTSLSLKLLDYINVAIYRSFGVQHLSPAYAAILAVTPGQTVG